MARRALIPGDVVAAVEPRSTKQLHIAHALKMDQGEALENGVLYPHRKYVVLARFQPGHEDEPPSPRDRWMLLIGLPGDVLSTNMWGRRPCVRPGAVRMWTNPKERRRRRLAEVASQVFKRKGAVE